MSGVFKGKHAVVTGGVNGIGQCVVERFLDNGAYVSVIDVDDGMIGHDRLSFFKGDIAGKSTLERFVASLKRPVDFIINNACVSRRGIVSGCTWEDFEYVQRVGVIAPYYLVSLIEKNVEKFAVVNIASTRAFQSQEDTESYSAAKGGIAALTHALSVSLAGRARVNSISPGWIETLPDVRYDGADNDQHPVGRVGRPNDVAELALFLCDESRAGFITGENIVVDGGMSRLMVYHGDRGWEKSRHV